MHTRDVTIDDVPQLRAVIDAQESNLDPAHKPAHEAWPVELVRGHYGAPRNRVWYDDEGTIQAWASMQPDEQRRRIEIEMFRRPGFDFMPEVWRWCLDVVDTDYRDWVVWPTIHWRDEEIASILRSTGFDLLRKYHILTRPISGDLFPELPTGASISLIASDEDYLLWHAAHQDAFSQHFGFLPRPAETWIEHFRKYEAADPQGQFLLWVDGAVAGFVSCADDNAELNGGYVQVLGVRHEFQGRGLGELLLRWAIAYCATRGFSDVDLTVDTGNESGALALYDKLMFTRLSEFHLYARQSDEALPAPRPQ